MPLDEVGEACGVAGLWHRDADVARLCSYALVALQHRGQESAGVVTGDRRTLRQAGGMGLVQQVFDEAKLAAMRGHVAVGHVRYATAGGSTEANIQPLLGITRLGSAFALAHNGNLTGIGDRERSPDAVAGGADTQELVDALADRTDDVAGALRAVLPQVRGAFSIVVATTGALYAARDPQGFRPLCLGRLPDGGLVVVSETVALDTLGATLLREVAPGELVTIDDRGTRGELFADARPAPCVFERVYFARQDSLLDGVRVQGMRHAMGVLLAREAPAVADVVTAVPDTARPAAMGYAQESGLPYVEALVRNQYLGRTFIKPSDFERSLGVRMKINVVPEAVAGKRVVVVDDSIVRSTSMREVVQLLRRAGAAEVHVRVSSAPVRWPCFFGVNMRSRAELVASDRTVAEVGVLVGGDSLNYLSVRGMVEAAGGGPACTGCFTGVYPAAVPTAGHVHLERTVPAQIG
ncbi:amidophosphoribosyltransferase [Lentzea xinjiangensis]|uniref:Amidophosphoribosyltransferase n=1 Tax=Lentzea xinjiangensis TaxID=402600 RepID=A0A1H9WMI5_9PSEU|nr:amidophosphoribosyltransferase [Lentzea xinjiangensis]SES35108.1 amidophosphoribosyltransferase [Lentzea xinjiangensis]